MSHTNSQFAIDKSQIDKDLRSWICFSILVNWYHIEAQKTLRSSA